MGEEGQDVVKDVLRYRQIRGRYLAVPAPEAADAGALVLVDPVGADAVVPAGTGGALVYVRLAVLPGEACRGAVREREDITGLFRCGQHSWTLAWFQLYSKELNLKNGW